MISDSYFLTGPTAAGKSRVAMALAQRLGAEIISVDSMQVYRGLDIGTAKPSAEDRKAVRHHLIDVCNLHEHFDAAQFCRAAREAENAIEQRGGRALFCGGTGLYLKALVSGLSEAPPSDPSLRAALKSMPLSDLLQELQSRDPATFATIDRLNPRRVVRAVEAIRLSGKPLSTQKADWAAPVRQRIIGLKRDRAELNERIAERVESMFAAGLVAEVQHLLNSGLRENRSALQAIGYRQVVEHLDGFRSLAETIELVKIRTRQFAKRQLTWLNRQLPVHWVHVAAGDSPEETIRRVESALRP